MLLKKKQIKFVDVIDLTKRAPKVGSMSVIEWVIRSPSLLMPQSPE